MSMVSNHENQFRLVMVKLNMPGLHDLAFVDLLHEKDIPVVCELEFQVFDAVKFSPNNLTL